MDGKSKQQLLDNGYIPSQIAHDVYLHPDALLQSTLQEEELIKSCLESRRKKQPINLPIQKFCTYYQQYFHINEFSAHLSKDNLKFSSLSLKGDNERSKTRIKEFNNINYPVMRLWFNGDKNKKLECLVTGQSLEQISEENQSINEIRTYNLFELHHILTVNGLSVHKIDVDVQPSYLLGKRNLTLPKEKPQLIDLMNTVCICPNEHDKVHCSSRFSDIKYWSARNAIPWGLKSEYNFKYFCGELNLNLNYQNFLEKQTLDWYEKNKETIDLNKNPQDTQEYLSRFE